MLRTSRSEKMNYKRENTCINEEILTFREEYRRDICFGSAFLK